MITRLQYDFRVSQFLQLQDDIRRSINFLRIFNPELSTVSIERQATRLEEYGNQLTELSKQLRSELPHPAPPQAQEQAQN